VWPVDPNQPAASRNLIGNSFLNTLSQPFGVGVIRADDNSPMIPSSTVEPNKMPAVLRQDNPSSGQSVGQNLLVENPLAGPTSLSTC